MNKVQKTKHFTCNTWVDNKDFGIMIEREV